MQKRIVLLSILCSLYCLFLYSSVFAGASVKRAVIFDCDGVLVDTEDLHFFALQQTLEKHGVSIEREEYLPLVGHSGKYILKTISERRNVQFPDDMLDQMRACYRAMQIKGVPLFNDAISFAKLLATKKQELNIVLGLASSSTRAAIMVNLEHAGLTDIFDVIVSGCDDLGKYVDPEGTNKPKPYIYQEAARLLGVEPSQCVVFEDSNVGLTAAVSAGMTVIARPNIHTSKNDFSKVTRVIRSFDEISVNDVMEFLPTFNNSTESEGIKTMKMRVFQQNKLWRDKAVGLLENTGSKIYWERLDDAEYNKQLRLKILEEAQEVASAASREDLISELADVVEVIQAMCSVNNVSWDDIVAAQDKKRSERGGFEGRMFITKAAHLEGSFGEKYCLKDPEKYPEIKEETVPGAKQVLHKNQSQKHANAPTCRVHEYPLGDANINGAVAELNGRYPEQDRVTNTVCKELAYVINGSGKVVVEGKEVLLNQGDMVLIQAGEKYYWEGQMTLFLSCTPAWYPEQHKQIT